VRLEPASLSTLFPTEDPDPPNSFLEVLVGIMLARDLRHDQNEPAGDPPFPQLI
jgi:hypothetical protein